jgi:hypothetical protein
MDGMPDFTAIQRMLQDPHALAALQQPVEQEVDLNSVPVPVRRVPPDIILSGDIHLDVHFKPWQLAAKTEQDIKEMVWRVMAGDEAPDLPRVTMLYMNLYREEVEDVRAGNNLRRADGSPQLPVPGRSGQP